MKMKVSFQNTLESEKIGVHLDVRFYLKCATTNFAKQAANGPGSEISNEELCIFAILGAANLPDVKI